MACPRHEAKSVPPLVQNGAVRFQAHHVGWIVCGMFTLVASVASAWLIRKHLRWYSCKPQQRHIVRLLFMVPIYAIITLASYIYYTHATSLILVRDAYESVVLASFFSLLLEHLPGPVLPGASGRKRNSTSEAEKLTPSQHGHGRALSKKERAAAVHRVFYNVPMHPDPTRGKPLKWIWPLGRVKARPKDGLSYLHWMKWGVLQYCVVRPGSTLAAVILDNMNLYCEESWSWRWGHVWVVTIVSISVTVAMYCLIQLYTTISKELKPYRPLLKLFAVKAVVFLTFWQGALLSGLASLDIIKDGEYLTAEQIVIGFAALLQTFEMMCFAFLHVKAFSYVPYKRLAQSSSSHSSSEQAVTFPTRNADLPATGQRQFMNLVQAFTFTDTWRDLQAGVLYFFGRGTSRQADETCRRDEGYREVFGRERVRVRVDTITERERRSFTKIRGYKGLPEDDKAIRLGDLQYSPLTCPDDQHLLGLDDPPPASILRAGRKGRKWPASPPVSPPPRGAYVPVHGPHASLGWEEVYSPRRIETRGLGHGETRNSPRRETHIPASEVVTRSGLLSPVSPSRAARDLHCPIPPNHGYSPGSQRPDQALPSPRSPPSPHHPLPSPQPERRPSLSGDSLLQRVFSNVTRTTESRGLDSASTRSGGTRVGEFGERSSYFGSSELLSSVEDAGRARVVPIRTGVPTLVPLGGSTGSSTTSASWHTPHTPVANQLPSPPEPARAPRRSGPNTQPRSVVLPAPLSPARYPHATWRTMTNQSSRPPAVRTQGLTHVSSVHVRPSHWSPVQPGSAGSSESGLAGRAAGRSSVGATYEPMSSLSTLSNISDRYPDAPRNSREG